MANAYKKFTANDIATVPFNAHKLYNFTSASAVLNKVTYFNANWTSESIDLYSSESIKYNQIDHLFYRQYILGGTKDGGIKPSLGGKNIDANRFGTEYDFLKHKRALYNKAGIISMPSGYYGHSIKKGSFSISGSRPLIKDGPGSTLIDDSEGNLIVSGTIIEDYVTDHRKNILNIGPQKAR